MGDNNEIEDFVARPYQSNIIEVCKRQNSIVFLPTGAGKSYIALQVIKHFSHQLEQKYEVGGKRSFFLVNTQVLAKQQAEVAQKAFSYKVAIVTGEIGIDNFSKADWLKLLNENEILVMTAQCFADGVTHSFINLEQANVIIFDECHHGRKGHVFHQIMQSFEGKDMSGCRVIGLSGMLIGVDNSIKSENVHLELQQLEATFQSTIITVNNLEDHKNALMHSTKAVEFSVKFTLPIKDKCVTSVCCSMDNLMNQIRPVKLDKFVTLNPKTLRPAIPTSINDLIKYFKDVQYQAENMGAYGMYLDLLSVLIQLELSKRYAITEKYRNLVRSCIPVVERCIHRMKVELMIDAKDTATIRKNSSQKVINLIDCLKELFTDPNRDKDLQCLVFTKRRSSAKALYHLIRYYALYSNENQEEFPLLPDFVVGQNNELPGEIENIVSSSFNMKAIEKFANKETNCIFCTNVLEEGIDLQLCNAVIMYDAPETFRSYMQSRGRARDDKSKYIVMIDEEGEKKFKTKMIKWRNVDNKMKEELICKTLDREPPSEENISQQQLQAWKPFITSNGSELKALNSISFLNQYAQTMASDKFSTSPIEWRRIDEGPRQIRVGIRLPPVIMDEIISDVYNDVKLGKQHAAFKTCIELYNAGELTEYLTPFSNDQKIELVEDDYFAHWKKYEGDNKKKAGTKNYKRRHAMKIPDVLVQSSPIDYDFSYIYRIAFRPKFDTIGAEFLKSFHELLGNGASYGIMTAHRLPKLCKMSLFPSWGEVECEIETPPIQYSVKNEDELKKLRKFQVTVFRDVLDSWRPYFVIDKTSFIVVPLDEDRQINWKLVDKFQQLPKPVMCQTARNTDFKVHEYLNKIVTPTYREANSYIVFKILEDKTPLSQFPEGTNTYKKYYKEKYEVDVSDDQFLLEVKAISKNWNLFFPGKGITGEKRANSSEILIPELCHNFEFPGEYWLKALFLPSVLHRAHFLLLAEELRMRLINDGIDEEKGEQIYQLDVDYGDYSARNNDKNDTEEDDDMLGKDEFEKALMQAMNAQSNAHKVPSKAQLMFDPSKLPIDIDRNWLKVTEFDIDYYVKFMTDNAGNVAPSNMRHLRTHVRQFFALKDSEFREDIKLLKVNSKNSTIQQKDLVKVLTTSNAGDVFDMERYETLGDAFLKFIASLFLFKTHEKWHEGHLTSLKGRLVSNRNLFYIGNDYGLSTMLKTTKFCCDNGMFYGLAPSTTLPHNISKSLKANPKLLTLLLNIDENLTDAEVENGHMNEEESEKFLHESSFEGRELQSDLLANICEQEIGDKIIADAVEGLIGCVISSVGVHSAVKLCGKLNILPNDDLKLNELLTEKIPPRMLVQGVSADEIRINNRHVLEKKISYTFVDHCYLLQALTHSSYPMKSAGTYEQLEFLGDAVLDFLITSYISEQCPKMDPGMLTDLRSALVNNVTLACIVVRNDLHKFLRYENHALSEAIKKFVDYQDSVKHQVTDQIVFLETEDESNAPAESIDIPKCLGDLFESIIGAVFLDSGLSLDKTWKVIYELMKGELHEFMTDVPKQIVRQLYEYHKGSAKPKFYAHIAMETGETAVPVSINCHGERKVFLGIGKNRELAKKAAAKRALKELMQ